MVGRPEPRRILLCGTVTRAQSESADAPARGSLRSLRPYGGAVLAPAAPNTRLTGPAALPASHRASTRLAA
ncbi:MAG TPA: hypothetical protein VFX49_12810 [Chloroflexota bacterium]|nr:hypothetical protein [Chloroflexota bacterium]